MVGLYGQWPVRESLASVVDELLVEAERAA